MMDDENGDDDRWADTWTKRWVETWLAKLMEWI